MNEAPILREVLRVVNASGRAFMWRNQSGVVKVRRAFMHLAPLGSPDLIGYALDGTGRLVAFEIKQPKGRTSDEQKAWQQRLTEAGCIAAVVRSPAEALAALGCRS